MSLLGLVNFLCQFLSKVVSSKTKLRLATNMTVTFVCANEFKEPVMHIVS